MDAFIRETAIAAPLDGINIDTDQIIPARFLKFDRSQGYGRFLFHDLRFDAEGREKADFVLNQAPFREARILVADRNFGCGSSREGAVYALRDRGFRAVVAPSFGDIFYNNSLKNGLVPVRLSEDVAADLRRRLLDGPDRNLSIDLEAGSVTLPGGATHRLELDPFWRECIMKGLDEIALTQSYMAQIENFEERYLKENPWVGSS